MVVAGDHVLGAKIKRPGELVLATAVAAFEMQQWRQQQA
jgi:hypothetical protein